MLGVLLTIAFQQKPDNESKIYQIQAAIGGSNTLMTTWPFLGVKGQERIDHMVSS